MIYRCTSSCHVSFKNYFKSRLLQLSLSMPEAEEINAPKELCRMGSRKAYRKDGFVNEESSAEKIESIPNG